MTSDSINPDELTGINPEPVYAIASGSCVSCALAEKCKIGDICPLDIGRIYEREKGAKDESDKRH